MPFTWRHGWREVELESRRPLSGDTLAAWMRGVPGFRGVFDADEAPVLTRPGDVAIANLLPRDAPPEAVGHWVAYGVARSGPNKGAPVYFDSYGMAPGEENKFMGLPPGSPVGEALEKASRILGRPVVVSGFPFQRFGPGSLSRDVCGDYAVLAARTGLDLQAPVFQALAELSPARRNANLLALRLLQRRA